MEKAGHEQQQQGALKCPRCDSSNTKFCYYNNYSLSQPRHFCKACKRYWTRGGTLRNVPVGGGCRKNKHHRLKRPSTTPTTADPSSAPPHSQLLHQTDPAPSSNHHHHHHVNPLFHGLAYASAGSNPCDDVNNNNLALFSSRFLSSSRIPSSSGLFDLIQPPQMNNNALGLGFSSGGVMSTDNGFFTSNISNHDNNNTPFPISYTSIFSSSSSACSSTCTTTTMMPNNNSSVLGSSMMMMQQQQQQHKHKVVMNNNNGGRNMITSFDGGLVEVAPQMGVSGGGGDDDVEGVVGASKDVKVELGQNRLLEFSWNNTTPSNSSNNNNGGGGSGTNFQNQQHVMNGTMMSISDPNPNPNPNSNSLYWNSTAAAALGGSNWSDQPNNIAPSLTTSFSHLATKLL